MRKLEGDRQDWADGTVGELALRARTDAEHHNAFADRLIMRMLYSPVANLGVHSFVTSVNVNMRIVKRMAGEYPVYQRFSTQEMADILCADTLPNRYQCLAIARSLQLTTEATVELEQLLEDLLKAQCPAAAEDNGLAASLLEQSTIVAFDAHRRDLLRRMANANGAVAIAQ